MKVARQPTWYQGNLWGNVPFLVYEGRVLMGDPVDEHFDLYTRKSKAGDPDFEEWWQWDVNFEYDPETRKLKVHLPYGDGSWNPGEVRSLARQSVLAWMRSSDWIALDKTAAFEDPVPMGESGIKWGSSFSVNTPYGMVAGWFGPNGEVGVRELGGISADEMLAYIRNVYPDASGELWIFPHVDGLTMEQRVAKTSGMTRNQMIREWEKIRGLHNTIENVYDFGDGWWIGKANSLQDAGAIGRYLRNCWQWKYNMPEDQAKHHWRDDHGLIQPGIVKGDGWRRYLALFDPDGLPVVAFRLMPITEQEAPGEWHYNQNKVEIDSPLCARNQSPAQEHLRMIWEYAAAIPEETYYMRGGDLFQVGLNPEEEAARGTESQDWPRTLPTYYNPLARTADYNGWTNWDTWHTALVMDNEYELYTEARRIAEFGDEWKLRDWAIENVIGPYNANRIQDAQEWNDIPQHDRLDYRFEDLKEKNPQAADIVDALGFGADVSDDVPDLIDPEMVNWLEIWENIRSEMDIEGEDDPLTLPESWSKVAMPYADNTFYHVIEQGRLPSVIENGLQPRGFGQAPIWDDFDVDEESVYLWPTVALAQRYTEIKRYNPGALMGDFEPRYQDPVVLRVTGLDLNKLQPDHEGFWMWVEDLASGDADEDWIPVLTNESRIAARYFSGELGGELGGITRELGFQTGLQILKELKPTTKTNIARYLSETKGDPVMHAGPIPPQQIDVAKANVLTEDLMDEFDFEEPEPETTEEEWEAWDQRRWTAFNEWLAAQGEWIAAEDLQTSLDSLFDDWGEWGEDLNRYFQFTPLTSKVSFTDRLDKWVYVRGVGGRVWPDPEYNRSSDAPSESHTEVLGDILELALGDDPFSREVTDNLHSDYAFATGFYDPVNEMFSIGSWSSENVSPDEVNEALFGGRAEFFEGSLTETYR